jgi:hypothetical protein
MVIILRSAATRQLDPKGCRMSYMRPSYARLNDFDTEHTRFASKYSLHLYREQGVDDDTKVCVFLLPCSSSANFASSLAQGDTRSLHSRKRRKLQAGSTDRLRSRKLLPRCLAPQRAGHGVRCPWFGFLYG